MIAPSRSVLRKALILALVLAGCGFGVVLWYEMTDYALLNRLQSSDAKVQYDALRELEHQVRTGTFRNLKSCLPHVCATLRETESRGLQERIIGILQNIPREEGEGCVADLAYRLDIEKSDVSLRLMCAAALGKLGSSEDQHVVDRLVTTLRGDPSAIVRRQAALALGYLPGSDNQALVLALDQGIKDPDPRTSLTCAFSHWWKSKGPRAGEAIIVYLGSPDEPVRRDAAGALSQIVREMSAIERDGPLARRAHDALQGRKLDEESANVRFWIDEALRGFATQ